MTTAKVRLDWGAKSVKVMRWQPRSYELQTPPGWELGVAFETRGVAYRCYLIMLFRQQKLLVCLLEEETGAR